MKKFYAILMIALCTFGISAHGQIVTAAGEPLTDLSGIKEGDAIAFQDAETDVFLYVRKYEPSMNEFVWRLQFSRSDFYGSIGQDASERYIWRVIDLKNEGGKIVCKFKGHTGTYIPVLDNDYYDGANIEEEEGDVFTVTKASTDSTWTIVGASGRKFGKVEGYSATYLGDAEQAAEFKIYKPTLGEAAPKVSITFMFQDEEGNPLPNYADLTQLYSVGGKVTVPEINWGYYFVSGADLNSGATVSPGDVLDVTEEATYVLTFNPWPVVTFEYYDVAGVRILDKDGDPAKYERSCEPGYVLQSWDVGGTDGYYISEEEAAKVVGIVVNYNDTTIKVTCLRSTIVTLSYVGPNGEEIRETEEMAITPGESLYLPYFDWYVLSAADSIYTFDYETQTGYTVGTQDTTIVLHYDAKPLPFEPTTIVNGQFAEGTKWYGMQFNGKDYAYYEAGSACPLIETDKAEDAMLWAFVGNLSEGFAIYNKAAGPSLMLNAEKWEDGVEPTLAAEGTKFLLILNWDDTFCLGGVFMNMYYNECYACLNDLGGEGVLRIKAGAWGANDDPGSIINFVEQSKLTGIEGVVADPVAGENKVYDLQGRLVKNPSNGIYIQNGKKVIFK